MQRWSTPQIRHRTVRLVFEGLTKRDVVISLEVSLKALNSQILPICSYIHPRKLTWNLEKITPWKRKTMKTIFKKPPFLGSMLVFGSVYGPASLGTPPPTPTPWLWVCIVAPQYLPPPCGVGGGGWWWKKLYMYYVFVCICIWLYDMYMIICICICMCMYVYVYMNMYIMYMYVDMLLRSSTY